MSATPTVVLSFVSQYVAKKLACAFSGLFSEPVVQLHPSQVTMVRGFPVHPPVGRAGFQSQGTNIRVLPNPLIPLAPSGGAAWYPLQCFNGNAVNGRYRRYPAVAVGNRRGPISTQSRSSNEPLSASPIVCPGFTRLHGIAVALSPRL